MTVTYPALPKLTVLRRKQVEDRTGLSRSTIYEKINSRSPRYDPHFPKPIRLSSDAVGWIEAEVNAWIALRVRHSRC
ncbi:helix-turn-helix transcriptional regulator [Pseudoduganella violacea]|uniref:Prophage regulatory protein n=1 Tax=Pseudoduganella violacea TaxID=1715466 RepID=A0A7W5B6R5_9BURK|nr:AlpA family phage regulatory protein [Pseudoduganella violacea]MBB3117568.1 prophage regulatory protein [Pseudoduganella violacea]